MNGDEDIRARSRLARDLLRRRIEETRAMRGNALCCSECGRLSIGLATGWTMRFCDYGELRAFCPECDELEFG